MNPVRNIFIFTHRTIVSNGLNCSKKFLQGLSLSLRGLGLIILCILFLFGCLQAAQGNREYLVGKVIDGDTIELANGQMVRYLGIDTPEVRRRQGGSWVYAPEPYAEEAREFNRRLVEGKLVRLEFDVQKKDKYDRLLAYCFMDDVFVNARMLEEGFAMLYTSTPNIKYADMFVELQEEARQYNRGLWAASPVIAPKDARHFLGKIVKVEGKVTSVRQSPKVTILNFGQSKFKGVIFREEFPVFMAQGISLGGYKGRVVRITGKIKEYKDDFEIIIRHPSDIETVE